MAKLPLPQANRKSDKAIVSSKMDAIRDKILWSDDPLSLFLSLLGEELSWANRLPDISEDQEGIQPFIWTAYFTVKDYMRGNIYLVSDSYIRDLILKIAIQLAEEAEIGTMYAISSRSSSSSSLQVAFANSSDGIPIPEVNNLLKGLDKFKQVVGHFEKGRW